MCGQAFAVSGPSQERAQGAKHSPCLACLPLPPLLLPFCCHSCTHQVAAGTARGSVTIYDTASGRLLAVQRLLAGPGAVSCLAGWVPPDLLAGANLAGGGPRLPDGGGVLPGPGVGAGIRQQHDQHENEAVGLLGAMQGESGRLACVEWPSCTIQAPVQNCPCANKPAPAAPSQLHPLGGAWCLLCFILLCPDL